jgi:hypothetical protein
MMPIVAVIFWFVNFGISIWNAVAVGRGWVESKHAGGFARLVAWSGAIMSALGFTWCYLILLTVVGAGLGLLPSDAASAALSLGYIVIVLGVLSSGAVIMFDSWATAYRHRTLGNIGVAGYNTFTEMYNGARAVSGIPAAFQEVLSFFRGRDNDNSQIGLSGAVIGLVLAVLLGGVLTTWMIIEHVAGSASDYSYQAA